MRLDEGNPRFSIAKKSIIRDNVFVKRPALNEIDEPLAIRTGSNIDVSVPTGVDYVNEAISFAFDGYHQISPPLSQSDEWLSIYRDIDSEVLGIVAVDFDQGCDWKRRRLSHFQALRPSRLCG